MSIKMYFRRSLHESPIKQKDIMSQKRMELKQQKVKSVSVNNIFVIGRIYTILCFLAK